jgi:hypothetical protein
MGSFLYYLILNWRELEFIVPAGMVIFTLILGLCLLRMFNLGASIDPNPWVEPTPKTFPGTRWTDVIAFWKIPLYILLTVGTFVLAFWLEGMDSTNSIYWFSIIILVLVLIVVALFLLASISSAIRKTHDYMKYGRIPFHMKLCPASVGGSVEGVLELPKHATNLHQVSIKLVCVRNTIAIGSNLRSKGIGIEDVGYKDVWSYQDKVTAYWDGTKRTAVIDIKVPADLPVTDTYRSRQNIKEIKDRYYWVLKVHTKKDEINIEREFEIPIQINRASENQ